jgi:hypothetical protein
MANKWLTKYEILNLDKEHFPLLVLSYNYRSFISTGITAKTRGAYNHLMWAYRPGIFATQDWWYREVKMQKYLKHHRLKFWTNPAWTHRQKHLLKIRIHAELVKPRWKTRYDLLAILGQLVGITGIQVPWTNICSDHADYLKLVDRRYNLVHPSPASVNAWLKLHSDYKVFGRFVND